MALNVGLLTLTAPAVRAATIVQFNDSAAFCHIQGQNEARQISWPEKPAVARPFAPLLWAWAGVVRGREADPPLTATLTLLAGPPEIACPVAFDTHGLGATVGNGPSARLVTTVAGLFTALDELTAPARPSPNPNPDGDSRAA